MQPRTTENGVSSNVTPRTADAGSSSGHASGGSEPAVDLLGRLLDRYAAALELYARQWCDTAEDVVQEALIELSGQGRTPEDPVAWLFRVVRNKAISAARSNQRRKQREAEAARARPAWFRPASADALDAVAAAAALSALPIEQREMVVARIWGGLSFEQMGRLAGISDSAAHRRYTAALVALREKLGASCSTKP